VEDFSEYDRDLEMFMSEIVLPDCPPPYFALAHSMGGNVLLRAACRQDCWFERIVLTAPMLELTGRRTPAPLIAGICELAVFLGLGDAYIPGGGDAGWEAEPFEDNPLTSDERRYVRNREILHKAPELGLGAPTLAWARAACASMHHVTGHAFPARVHVPVLMLAAGRDAVVSSRAVEMLAAQLRAGAFIPLATARHEILQARNPVRAQFWAGFDAFVPGER
jgi:lysophospholipase